MRSKIHFYLLMGLFVFFGVITISLNISTIYEQQYVYLAKSFLAGKLYFLERPGTWLDAVFYNNYYYWHLGPAPAVLLMPIVGFANLLGITFYQGYLQLVITGGILMLCYKLARMYKFSIIDSLYLAFAFGYASVYVTVAYIPWSWYFVQAIVVACLFLALWEWHRSKRYWLIGILFAVILASRATAVLGIVFFIGDLWWRNARSQKHRMSAMGQMFLPLLLVFALLLAYNGLRFGDVFNTGYQWSNNNTLSEANRYELINYGLFQLRNIPTNFYYYFIKTVDPVQVNHYGDFGRTFILEPPYVNASYPGAGYLITSPVFVYSLLALRKIRRNRTVILSAVTSAILLLVLLTYYWPGWAQVGPRYMLDLQPFLYVMLLRSFVKSQLSVTSRIIIIVSALFNLYLVLT